MHTKLQVYNSPVKARLDQWIQKLVGYWKVVKSGTVTDATYEQETFVKVDVGCHNFRAEDLRPSLKRGR